MHADRATAESPKLNLPQDLLTEINRRGVNSKTDFRLEGWQKPSLLGRLMQKLLGKNGH